MQKITPDEVALIINLYDDGGYPVDIAKQIDRAPSTVYRTLRKSGRIDNLPERKARHGLTDEQIAEVVEMRRNNASYNKISFKFGVGEHTIAKICESAGVDFIDLRHGKNNVNWNGGRRVNKNGYVEITIPIDHPFRDAMRANRGTCMEHRFVMAEHIGRPLEYYEDVHHINGDRLDNRIDNLEIWSTKQPRGQRIEDKVEFALEILSLYRPDLIKVRS